MALEWRFSKDQILELYLNRVYFGGGAYGIDAASRRFFGHSATQLSRRRGGDHRRPGQGAVQLFADRRRRRRAQTAPGSSLDLMAAEPASSPRRRPPTPIPTNVQFVHDAGNTNITRYFTDWVLPQLDTLIDESVAAARRLDDDRSRHAARRHRNRSTPTRRKARRARWSRSTATARSGRWSAAATMSTSSYNRATQANRQPGSSFKLFVYLSALEVGLPARHGGRGLADHDQRLVAAQQTAAAISARCRCASPSLIRSTPSRCGSPSRSAPARSPTWPSGFGITTHIDTNPSMALGSNAVRLIDMTRAYAAVGARRRRGDALRHPPGDHRRRHPALPASGR